MNLVSIIICTYNQQESIRRTIDAILKQESRLPFEVIIGEDGSCDNTRSICQEYADKNPSKVRLMPKAPNKGVVQNYYDCVRAAKGDYIMECGGDDEWCPGRINLCLDVMENYPNVVQIFTDVWYRDEKTQSIAPKHSTLFPYGLIKGKDVIAGIFHQHHDQMVAYAMTRRSTIMQIMGKYPQFFCGRKYLAEDKQLITLLGTAGDFYNINKCTYYYTINGSSITSSRNYARIYNYDKNMLIMTHDLAEVLNYDKSKLYDVYSDLCYCMLSRVFLSLDKSLRDELRALIKEFEISLNGKNILLDSLMSNRFVWLITSRLFELHRLLRR